MPRTCVGQCFTCEQNVNVRLSLMYRQHQDLQKDYATDVSMLELSGLPARQYPIPPKHAPGTAGGKLYV